MKKLKAPFPYFGGKSRVAAEVWARFGKVRNYIEPFCGSCAVLLGNQYPAGTETVNDMDGYLCNFWRAVAAEPVAVAEWADWPVSELDIHARHAFLIARKPEFVERLRGDPDFYDVKIAGWWVWGINCWIGNKWSKAVTVKALPHLGNAGQGVHKGSLQLPHLGDAGQGVHKSSLQLPHLGDAGQGVHKGHGGLVEWFNDLQARLRRVRVCCGDWSRVCGECVTFKHGLTAVFLDPPYADEDRDAVYEHESFTVAHDVRKWCIENGDNPLMRIALCGYGEHEELLAHGWTPWAWKAAGGYGANNGNGAKEMIWFSPHCIGKGLFDE